MLTVEIKKSEGKFQENKDWNLCAREGNCCPALSEGKFQENKDWNLRSWSFGIIDIISEGKFQENKDWNLTRLLMQH